MKLWGAQFLIVLGVFAAVGCVTDKKQEDDGNYLRMQAENQGGPAATKVTVRCNVQNPKSKKPTPCSQLTAKLTDLASKAFIGESTFKGGAGMITVGRDVYAIDVTTNNCSTVRNFKGLMAGMVVDVYFDPPCGTK